jgi:hypothetical protein
MAGRNKLVLGELPWIGLAVGAVAAGFAFWMHGVLLKG